MGSTRSSQQIYRDAINVKRMVSRLEMVTEKQQHEPSTSYATLKDYYKIVSTLTSIKMAKQLLQESITEGSTRQGLYDRLDKLESHYQTVLAGTPKPFNSPKPRDLEYLRPQAIPASSPSASAQKHVARDSDGLDLSGQNDEGMLENLPEPTPEVKAAENLISLGEDDPIDPTTAMRQRHSSFGATPDAITPLSTGRPAEERAAQTSYSGSSSSTTNAYAGKKDTPTTQSLTNLLSHHRSEQESLTEELASMAERLKMNSLEFSHLLEKDKDLLQNAEEKLEGNLGGMIKERDRLKEYKKKGGVTTWFVIGAVLAVMGAWLFMFALMRIF